MKKRQTHYKERGQLEERKGLGILEKKRHFLARSKIAKEREDKIQNIKKLASEANPDEFHYFMYKYKRDGLKLVKKDKIEKPRPFETVESETETETPAQYIKRELPQRIIFTD